MRRNRPTILAVVVSVLLTASLSAARGAIDLNAAPDGDTSTANLIQVPHANSWQAAVSDRLGQLVIGSFNKKAKDKPGEFVIYPLDGAGALKIATPGKPAVPAVAAVAAVPATPTTPAVAAVPAKAAIPAVPPVYVSATVALPRPASLAAFQNYPLSFAFHPKLPLLYVWQDILGQAMTSAKNNVVFKEFDHLLIYNVSNPAAPTLVLQTCRGDEFSYGLRYGPLAFNAEGTRLFLPNLRLKESPDNNSIPAIGYLKLDAQGMPIKDGDTPAMVTQGITAWATYPPVLGCFPISDDITLFCGMYGPTTWDASNRRAPFCTYVLNPTYQNTMRMTLHPKLSVFYVTTMGGPFVYRMEHADGFVTLLPQTLTFGGAAATTLPVLMTKGNLLAFGGVNKIFFVALDAEGKLTNKLSQTPVANPSVDSLVYSERFDRLYVGVEQLPQ